MEIARWKMEKEASNELVFTYIYVLRSSSQKRKKKKQEEEEIRNQKRQ